jgi:hypothetical protein
MKQFQPNTVDVGVNEGLNSCCMSRQNIAFLDFKQRKTGSLTLFYSPSPVPISPLTFP